jgi:hypothetical protein
MFETPAVGENFSLIDRQGEQKTFVEYFITPIAGILRCLSFAQRTGHVF